MPILQRPDGEIYYEEFGHGFPILLFAPGGLRSRLEMWHKAADGSARSWCDWTEVLADGYRVVTMDQRNAGRSRTAVEADHGWHTYAADHLALMDHLGHQRFHTLGGCIGGSFCLKLIEAAPDRVVSAVLQNPIGLHPEHPEYFPDSHAGWIVEKRAERPDLDVGKMEAFGRNMWDADFVFCVSRDFVRACPVPTLLLPGTDIPHPAATSDELARLLPGVEVVTPWRGPDHLDEQYRRVRAFLDRHTPRQDGGR
ncbi:MAG: alpha/beta fold hydrolase [Acetobacteraceae bacterium]